MMLSRVLVNTCLATRRKGGDMKRSRIIRLQLFLVARGHPASLLFSRIKLQHYAPSTDVLLHDTPMCLVYSQCTRPIISRIFPNPPTVPDSCAHSAMSIIHFPRLEYKNHKTRHQRQHLRSPSPRLPKNTQRTILLMVIQYKVT